MVAFHFQPNNLKREQAEQTPISKTIVLTAIFYDASVRKMLQNMAPRDLIPKMGCNLNFQFTLIDISQTKQKKLRLVKFMLSKCDVFSGQMGLY
jgi:hypothetical protein